MIAAMSHQGWSPTEKEGLEDNLTHSLKYVHSYQTNTAELPDIRSKGIHPHSRHAHQQNCHLVGSSWKARLQAGSTQFCEGFCHHRQAGTHQEYGSLHKNLPWLNALVLLHGAQTEEAASLNRWRMKGWLLYGMIWATFGQTRSHGRSFRPASQGPTPLEQSLLTWTNSRS